MRSFLSLFNSRKKVQKNIGKKRKLLETVVEPGKKLEQSTIDRFLFKKKVEKIDFPNQE